MAFPLQAHLGGTILNGIGNELIRFLIYQNSFCFLTVGFVYSR